MEFELSAHEVMRGIRVRHDALVLRPIGWVLAGSAADAVVGAVLVGVGITVAGLWWLALLPGAVLTADGLARLRVAVIATDDEVLIRNRWRTRRVPISEIQAVRAEIEHWQLRQPAYVLTRPGLTGSEWLVATVSDIHGRNHPCAALVSAAPPDHHRPLDPTPTEMKVETLRRWIDARTRRQ